MAEYDWPQLGPSLTQELLSLSVLIILGRPHRLFRKLPEVGDPQFHFEDYIREF